MSEALLNQLVAAVEAYYEDAGARPLLASRFGHFNKELAANLKAAYGGLLAAVKAAGEARLKVVDPRPGREVIVPAARAHDIAQKVREQSASTEAASSNFDSLPKSIQIAFCLRVDAGELVSVRVTPPFDYKRATSADLVRPGFRIVPEDYRRPGLVLGSATLAEKQSLWESFLGWAAHEQLDPATFRSSNRGNALARLLAAQPPDILARIVIPADIAEILLRRS